MKRRAFLAGSLFTASQFIARSVIAQTGRAGPRAAVVIGVNKPGNLPVLSAAASGAHQAAEWLSAQGFEVKLFADDQRIVKAVEIFDAVAEFVNRGTLEQLIIYFSGHGCLIGYAEYWMLSGAPDNPNEAISLMECVDLARQSAIPSVVFISDACRSTPDSLSSNHVRGSLIFPNGSGSRVVRTKIDQFLATLPGSPAFEVPVSQSVPNFQGVYTASFLGAFQSPASTMVRTVDGTSFISNRSLADYLDVDVRRRAEASSVRLYQRPDARIESDDSTYIGRVLSVSSAAPVTPSGNIQATLKDVAGFELSRAGADLLKSAKVINAAEIREAAAQTGFDQSRQLILKSQESHAFETRCGFLVTGTRLAAATTNPGLKVEILDAGDGDRRLAIIQVDAQRGHAGSIALQFSGGNGTVVAALPEFVGNVVVDGEKVINVSYLPAQNSERWSDYASHRSQLDGLRATVATSAKFGEFRIEGETETRNRTAEQLADRIRVLKGLDPTLGIYAAYAYADAGLLEKVRSVRSYMRDDLGVDLFDVVMLSGGASEIRPGLTVPFCPMLTQGWNLLRVRGVRLAPGVSEARDHLREALWTTFDSVGLKTLMNALQDGKLQ